ncbi:MAG: DNA primase [Candidatus Borkfalkiaceae bacterium]|nr:DNA primase [Christensenellaceae bacterium]
MAFDEKFIEELKQKNNIVDIVGRYCTLQKRGKSHWACCPLPGHSEKTPSFTVNEDGQFFKCFGCGQGGDVITFVRTMENLDYVGAVKYLADQCGMAMPDDDRDYKQIAAARSRRERLLSLMRTAALFYVHNLEKKEAEEYRGYLRKRGIDGRTVTAFGIGASLDRYSLVRHLSEKGFREEEMLLSGVCQKKTDDSGKTSLFDAQYGRLIIPIINNLGNVIAFGGRVLEAKPKFAKYKNTQETELFVKNRTLFNINNLKKEKNANGLKNVVMVEGYMDVISVYSAGFRNVVASMGTSLTVEQARMLRRYADTVLISYDGDAAGQHATLRGLDILKNEGIDVRVVRLPEGLDPDDVIRKYGAEEYRRLLDESLPLVDFKLENAKAAYDLGDLSSRRKYVTEALKIIAECKMESEKEELLRKLGRDTSTTYESLRRDLSRIGAKEGESPPVRKEEKTVKEDGTVTAVRFVLCACIFNKPYAKDVPLYSFCLSDPVHVRLADAVQDYREEGKEIFPSALSGMFTEEELSEYNAVLTAGDSVFGTPAEEKFFADCVGTLRKQSILQQIDALKEVCRSQTDTEKRMETFRKIAELNKKLSAL